MKIGVLALQGAFAEHEKVLEQLGAECIELRQARDLSEPYDALVLPDVYKRQADMPNSFKTVGLPEAESSMTTATTMAFKIRKTGE